jgi:hypothetical protein
MQKSVNGVFNYRASIIQCMEDIRKLIEKKIKDDHAGTFDVIKFLKDMKNR